MKTSNTFFRALTVAKYWSTVNESQDKNLEKWQSKRIEVERNHLGTKRIMLFFGKGEKDLLPRLSRRFEERNLKTSLAGWLLDRPFYTHTRQKFPSRKAHARKYKKEINKSVKQVTI